MSVLYNLSIFQQAPSETVDASPSMHPTSLQNLMDDIIVEGEGLEGNDQDVLRADATKVLETYLSRPIPRDPDDPSKKLNTFVFWREHEKTVDRTQRCLCKIAKRYLTPPPTSTGKLAVNFFTLYHNTCQLIYDFSSRRGTSIFDRDARKD